MHQGDVTRASIQAGPSFNCQRPGLRDIAIVADGSQVATYSAVTEVQGAAVSDGEVTGAGHRSQRQIIHVLDRNSSAR